MLQKVRNQSGEGKANSSSRQQKNNYVQKTAMQLGSGQNLKETQGETKSQLIMVPMTQSASTPNHASSNQNTVQKGVPGQNNTSSVKKITKFAFQQTPPIASRKMNERLD